MAFPEMRRKDRKLEQEEALKIITENQLGYLGMTSPSGYPYVVPMNYVYQNDTVYLHGAQEGHKIDCLKTHPEVCFTVVGDWRIIPEHTTTAFESAIAFGRVEFIEDTTEKKAALGMLLKHAGVKTPLEEVCAPALLDQTAILAIHIEHLTGKRRPSPRVTS